MTKLADAPGGHDPFSAPHHDHASCIEEAVQLAERVCTNRGVRLTPLRRRVLELVWRSHAPVGAYQILQQLGTERANAAPPTIYRALDFLAAHGLVHRLDTLNAFVGCDRPAERHKAYFLICRSCRNAAEFESPELEVAIATCGSRSRFSIESETVELSGVCADCRRRPAAEQATAATGSG